MADTEIGPSVPPLSPSPATSPGGGDAIISIQILEPEPDTLVESILHEMQTNNDNNKEEIMFTIPKVPLRLRRGKNDAYAPNIISIGPYHRGNPRLQAMEKKKFEHLNDFLSSAIVFLNSSIGLEGLIKGLIKKLKSQEDRVRGCYTVKFKLTSEEFVEMMLLDSCFIIHHLLQLTEQNRSHDLTWIAPLISYDLLLLENQLPFFLVQIVFDIVFPPEHSPSVPSLVSLAYDFHCQVTHNKIYEDKKKDSHNDMMHPLNPNKPVLHLLHLCHSFIISPDIFLEEPKSERIESKKGQSDDETRSKKSEEKEEESEIMIPNATVLHDVGIRFRRRKWSSILDVKFSDGVLEIPPLFIHDGSVSQFQNLIALEHCCDFYFSESPQFTAYFKFMDHIINTVSDVALLQKNGIIQHTFGSEKEVAQLFNQLTRGATINPNNYLSGLYKRVNKYHKTKRHIWGTMFLRRHCSNPLTILSAIGFLFLLSLTFIQSYFSVFAYFRPPP